MTTRAYRVWFRDPEPGSPLRREVVYATSLVEARTIILQRYRPIIVMEVEEV